TQSPWFLKVGLVNSFQPLFLHWSLLVNLSVMRTLSNAGPNHCVPATVVLVKRNVVLVPVAVKVKVLVVQPIFAVVWPVVSKLYGVAAPPASTSSVLTAGEPNPLPSGLPDGSNETS